MHISALESLHIEIFQLVVRHNLQLRAFFLSLLIKSIQLETFSEMSPLFSLIIVSAYLPLLAGLQRRKLLS
jgi:hypothetical protein